MRILYDGFIYDWQQFGGINRYFNEIIRRLDPADEPIVTTFLGRRDFWPVHPRLRPLRSRPFARLPALAPLGRKWLEARTGWSRADLVHPTYYHWLTPALADFRGPLVATVHDMIHELFPDELDPDRALARAKRRLVERADLILCNSESTRRDLVAFFPAAAARTRVTPLATSLAPAAGVDAAEAPSAPPYF